ncbi:MAG: hypothetical protein F6K10_30605 [Moorea sp. SIO2B7]|nr:hypothetical protein [Moorena sp. SIO2B7]
MEEVANQLAHERNFKAAKFLHTLSAQLHHILTAPVASIGNEKQQVYLDLIQALLDSPKDKRDKILAANKELIEPGLVQTIKKVANQALIKQDFPTANWLNQLAVELNRSWLQEHEFQSPPKDLIKKSSNYPDQKTASVPELKSRETAPLEASASDIKQNKNSEELLTSIAQSLSNLEKMISKQLKPVDTLWYLERLERAQECNWILTTQEVEQLIGFKPQCKQGTKTYERGSWIFVQTGKLGSQTAWRILKKESNKPSLQEQEEQDPWIS